MFQTATGSRYHSILPFDFRLSCKSDLTAFVGHRFTPQVTNSLRHNLRRVAECYGIRLLYADTDMPNAYIFESILQSIRTADFCIFDDRETEVRPKSDLAGMLCLPYTTYEDLFLEFALRLPGFLVDRKFAAR